MRIRANEVLELTMRYGSYMYHANSDRDYSQQAIDAAFKDYTDYAETLGINTNKAAVLAEIGNKRYAELRSAGTEYIDVEFE